MKRRIGALYVLLPIFIGLSFFNPGSIVATTFGAIGHFIFILFAAILFWSTAVAESSGQDRMWYRISIGFFIWSIAILFRLCEMYLHQPGYGTVADSFWVLGNLLLILGVLGWFLEAKPSRIQMLLAFLIPGAAMALLYSLSLQQLLTDPARSDVLKSLDIFYIASDLLILAFLFVPARRVNAWGGRLMFCGFLLFFFSDLAFIHVASNRDSDVLKYLDIPYTVSDFFLAVAAGKQLELVTRRNVSANE
jgi:uncharacterized membrane protein